MFSCAMQLVAAGPGITLYNMHFNQLKWDRDALHIFACSK